MKRSYVMFLSIVMGLYVVSCGNLQAQRNRWSNNIDWRMIVGDSNRYKIFFPHDMEAQAREASAEFPTILKRYREKLFVDSMIVIFKDSLGREQIKKDSLGNPIIKHALEFWRPDSPLVVVLYANPQQYTEQMIVYDFLPPGILGFTELMNERVALPYGGNDHEFRAVLAHELIHALERLFIKEQAARARLADLPNHSNPNIPPWSTEGFAEYGSSDQYLDSLGERSDYRRARTEFRNLVIVTNEETPTLELLELMGDFGVYSFGHDFNRFMARRFSPSSLVHLKTLFAYHASLDSAWLKTFKEPLSTSEAKWWESMKVKYEALVFSAYADTLPTTPLTEKTHKGIDALESVGAIGFDRGTQRMVFYEENKKWGVDVKTYGLDTGLAKRKIDAIDVDHQFDDKTLWYRVNNAPAIFENMIAVIVSSTDRNHLRLYELSKDGADLKEEFMIPGVLWINDLVFVNRDSLLFVGIDSVGQQDIYLYHRSSRATERLTNDSYAKMKPGFMGNHLVYIEHGGFRDKHQLIVVEDEKKQRIDFNQEIFVDDWIADSNFFVLRTLTEAGVPDLYFWTYGDRHANWYRYGTPVEGLKEKHQVHYPLLGQLIGFARNGDCIVHETHSKYAAYGRFVTFRADTAGLLSVPVAITADTSLLVVRHDTVAVNLPADRKARYRGFFLPDGPFDYSWPEMVFTDAMGETGRALSFYLMPHGGYQHMGVRWFDFSGRLWQQTTLGITVTPRLTRSSKDGDVDFLKEGLIRAERWYTWPFSLQEAVTFRGGLGFLLQQPPDVIERDSTKKGGGFFGGEDTLRVVPQPPFLEALGFRFGVNFTSDGTFVDYFRSTRHGHHFGVSFDAMEGVVGPLRGKLVNFIFETHLTYYLRPWQSRVYFAGVATYGLSGGYAPYAFFIPDLYREPGFYGFTWHKSFGNKYLIYKLEARLPLIRTFLTDYEFWEHKYPFWFFSFTAAPFLYGGDVAWLGEPLRFVHRGGIAFKSGAFGFIPLYLRFERYKFLEERPWHSAWILEIEY